jgi:hypothetical protein
MLEGDDGQDMETNHKCSQNIGWEIWNEGSHDPLSVKGKR